MPGTITLPVEGMRCAGCAGAIERSLMARQGVLSAAVSLPASSLAVSYDPAAANGKDLVAAVESAGRGSDRY